MTYLPRKQKAYSAALTNEQKKIPDERAGISAAEEIPSHQGTIDPAKRLAE